VQRAYRASCTVAAALVVVDSLDDNARRFCAGFGFASFLDDPLYLYLPIRRVATLG